MCNFTTMKWQWADGSPVDYKPPLGTQNGGIIADRTNKKEHKLEKNGKYFGLLPDLDKPCGKCSWFGYANGDWKQCMCLGM